MRFDNVIVKRTVLLGLIIGLVVWLSLLTQKSSQHTNALTVLNQKVTSSENAINYQYVNEKIIELSKQMAAVQHKNNQVVLQTQLSEVEQELRNRVQQVSRQFDNVVSHEQLQQLQTDVTTQLSILNEQLAQLSTNVTQINNEAPKTQASVQPTQHNPKSTAVNIPFIIQGKELRAGEWVLSVLPVKQKNIESSVLLTVGQHLGLWQLVMIEEHHAVFSVGKQKRRLAIPNQ